LEVTPARGVTETHDEPVVLDTDTVNGVGRSASVTASFFDGGAALPTAQSKVSGVEAE
jgi:hypothetical protein